jgi:hypothetical protein
MNHALSLLERFADLTAAMHQAAAAQDWDGVVARSKERDALRATMPANLAPHLLAPDGNRARTLIERCREVDAQTSALLGARRDELRVLLREPV